MKKSIYTKFGKRTLDLIFSIAGIILSIPLFLIIILIIKLTSKDKAIFYQKRVGKNQKIFTMYKFRTMYKGAEKDKTKFKNLDISDGPVFKIPNDPRFTTFGKILSKSSLDELPQLFNILKGDMSFVGPRPPIPDEVKHYKQWQLKRFNIKPGLTSQWVIEGMNRHSFNDWIKSDIKYSKNITFLKDIKIILLTIYIQLMINVLKILFFYISSLFKFNSKIIKK